MNRRAVRVAAAAAAVGLAVLQIRTWRAERAYERGIWATDPRTGRPATDAPARDVPGRLEAYDEARSLDPSNPLYGLRAAQIEIARVARAPRDAARDERVSRVHDRLRDVLAAAPLEGRAHDALAHVFAENGDLDGAIDRTRRSVALAKRRPSTLEVAAHRFVWGWRRTWDPDILASALDVARLGYELKDGRDPSLGPDGAPGTGPVRELLASAGGPTVDDVRLAIRGREELRDAAARLLDAVRPEDAAKLRAEAPR